MTANHADDRSSSPDPLISVVIPAYNEEEALGPLLEEVFASLSELSGSQELSGGQEVIVVNDGSTDGTEALLRRYKETQPTLRILNLIPNSGQSAAFEAGFRAARGELIITMDADGQNDPADMGLLIEASPGLDAVLGVRADRQDPWIRKFAQRIANSVRNTLLGTRFQDVGCSLKLFRREIIQDLTLYNGLHRFFPYLVEMRGGRTVEVNVSHRARQLGTSKYSPLGRGIPAFLDLMMVRRMKKRALRYHVDEVQ
ncbi:MAG: glycosyltransferase family 2 protein [Planctomycetes bacterium]|nr:glycosyltransferase family 2 protein [Planctomycetota bacterium]MBT6453385.1 glycosyltransferase family 2 protein [Planctomycetota bacterium]MBT6542132.1 glycosyltransferase family 2 protein [Planctomycetota bacterium]MBT6783457.1 glycosyltransferase family 2 protein [Planctomycetota bacterium]MBT6967310.1 glycosyltransferase family 2 protein [Planctomycetota bacterium]